MDCDVLFCFSVDIADGLYNNNGKVACLLCALLQPRLHHNACSLLLSLKPLEININCIALVSGVPFSITVFIYIPQ